MNIKYKRLLYCFICLLYFYYLILAPLDYYNIVSCQDEFNKVSISSKISLISEVKTGCKIEIGDSLSYYPNFYERREFNDVVEAGDYIIKPINGDVTIIKCKAVKYRITEYSKFDFLGMPLYDIEHNAITEYGGKRYMIIPKGKILKFKVIKNAARYYWPH